MCTLALILDPAAPAPLIVAANRDESRARPTRAPFLWEAAPRLVAGRDETAGGTWLGLNERGLFAAVTNLWTGTPPDPSRPSRGALVVRLLAAPDLAGARQVLGEPAAREPNPFILVCADLAGRAFWVTTADALAPHPLAPGIHSFGNQLPWDRENAKQARALRRVEDAWHGRAGDGPDEIARALAGALSAHDGDRGPRESLCVHTGGDFGTVSSAILVAGPDLGQARLWYAPGPPCTTPYEDLSAAVRALAAPAGAARAGGNP